MSSQPETYLDERFAKFMTDRSGLEGAAKDALFDIVFRLSISLSEGHSCMKVSQAEQSVLQQTHVVAERREGGTASPQPLVLDRDNLYLERYYTYEARLASQIRVLAETDCPVEVDAGISADLFPGESVESSDQMRAAVTAIGKALMIVSGGPGTGKTTTVVKMLALLLMHEKKGLRIGLAAPTGKAAMRLSESVGKSLEHLSLPSLVTELIPKSAVTLHRLLGVKKHSPQFRHNSSQPLKMDVVVVDEASMVDLAMMSKLVDALKPGGRLILLGDKDQLASVESGAVLNDFILSLPGNSVELKKTYRFDDNIKRLATCINNSDHGSVWRQLTADTKSNVSHLKEEQLHQYIALRYGEYLRCVQDIITPDESDVRKIFECFNRFQVLCGVAFTEHGVKAINRKLEQRLALKGFQCKHEEWYPGRPVLITRNDYGMELFNGDIGICLWDNKRHCLRVWFERADGSLKSCAVNLLPPHETVYAMTIHKSQGSEFGEVLVVLPKEDNRVLSRELIYTAVTRAKKAVRLSGDGAILKLALERQLQRHSGLRLMLQGS
ncbi:RecBCD enzyme subunit RecD [Desulforhopalus sp. 52FAK]